MGLASNQAAKRGQGYGYNCVLLDGKIVEEHDTFQCCHCWSTTFIEPTEPSPWCNTCGKQHCFKPECRICRPFMRRIEHEEAIARAKMLLWREADNV